MDNPKRILISRTDSIGDVILTLPMAGMLKSVMPNCTVLFLGQKYTKDVVALSTYVDEFIDWGEIETLSKDEQIKIFRNLQIDAVIHVFPVKEIASVLKKSGATIRIGSTGRIYHYQYCNKLVPLSRKNSDLHEAQLNFKLLKPLIGEQAIPSVKELNTYYGFDSKPFGENMGSEWIDNNKFNLILHPKSKGSAREWPLEYYSRLIGLLPNNKYKIFITGTDSEAELISAFLEENKEKVTNLCGQFTLTQLIGFISQADGLVAASTGPLHLAASLGKMAIGIYPPIRPMHPGRWKPIGLNAHFLVAQKECNDCRKTLPCACMKLVTPEQVANEIKKYG